MVTLEEMFDEFWLAYPRKVAKGAARKVFYKLKPHEEFLMKILKAIEQQKHSKQWQKDEGQFIPHPATWLNQERWDDEVYIVTMPKSKPKCACGCGREGTWIVVGNKAYASKECRIKIEGY